MILNEMSTVPDLDLPVTEFRAHLRLGTGFVDDTVQDEVLVAFLRAAMAAIEGQTGKAIIQREFEMRVSAWARSDRQPFPVAPVTDVAELALVDRNGAETIVDASRYTVRHDEHRPELLATGTALPSIPLIGSARVRFKAGLAPVWGTLPADLAQAVFLLAAYYYEQRAESGARGGWMPYGVMSLLRRYRSVRLSARAVQ